MTATAAERLCPSCDASYLRSAAIVVHVDGCPWLQAMRAGDAPVPCRAATTGFCDCPRHEVTQ